MISEELLKLKKLQYIELYDKQKEVCKRYKELKEKKVENEKLIFLLLENKYNSFKCRENNNNLKKIKDICNLLNDPDHVNIGIINNNKTTIYDDIEKKDIKYMLNNHMILNNDLKNISHNKYKFTGDYLNMQCDLIKHFKTVDNLDEKAIQFLEKYKLNTYRPSIYIDQRGMSSGETCVNNALKLLKNECQIVYVEFDKVINIKRLSFLRIDFFILILKNDFLYKCAIEFDGKQHYEETYYSQDMNIVYEKDIIKDYFCFRECISLLRIDTIDNLCDEIVSFFKEVTSSNRSIYKHTNAEIDVKLRQIKYA
jgi:hypothetical protein